MATSQGHEFRDFPAQSQEYARDYNSGWRASERHLLSDSYQVLSPLERADQRNVSHAWYDGYHDHAADRPKWTYREARLAGFDSAEEYLTAMAAAAIKAEAAKYGLTVTAELTHDFNPVTWNWDGKVIDATVTVEGTFTPGDARAYLAAEAGANTVLGMVPTVRSGSVWGTDSASISGHGLTGGYVRIHKSGAEIAVARQLNGPENTEGTGRQQTAPEVIPVQPPAEMTAYQARLAARVAALSFDESQMQKPAPRPAPASTGLRAASPGGQDQRRARGR